MNRRISFILGLFVILSILPLGAQALIKNSSVTGVCYAGTKINRIYIPPPPEFFRKSGSKNGGSVTIYYTGFPSQAKTAMEYAASILKKLLPADTKVTITAIWEKISKSGVLAQTSITQFAVGAQINALNPFAYYPIALAEKIAGKGLNGELEGDITLTVNNSINWYLGTDGQTPVQKYDLVTVAIHEICHGLGFYPSMNTDGTLGWYGFNSLPTIYDTFVENSSGSRLTDSLKFKNFSPVLRTQLTGGQLYFNGPLLKKHCIQNNISITRAKLWAPSTWDGGSSISHLDESATLKENSLMTPFIDLGEAIHNPGKYTFSILGDIGWINTRIIHTPRRDTEENLSQILLSTIIKSDTTYNPDKVGIVYSFNKFLTKDSVKMNSSGSNDSYNISISIPSYNTELQYYFFVEDSFLRFYRSPSLYKDYPFIKNNRYHVFIGQDTVKPVITHSPVTYYLQTVDSIKFRARITDNLGIDSAYVEYKINNGPSKFVRFKKEKTDDYSIVFNARSLNLKGSDSIQYRIFAVDSAIIPNIAVLPKSGYYVTDIEEISSTLSGYATNFSNSGPDFFNIGFNIFKAPGFSKFGLHTKHPYESPEDNNKSIEYTSVLRHPLKFNESGLIINFSEVVLVEPGEAGSLFGSQDFYDYVILEGSRNFGKTWFRMADGYDSRLFSSWETSYNSSIVGNNSTFIGSETMLQNHTLYYRPSDNIAAGDTLLFRFRLYSDPFANGWGWVIQDLKINPLIDAVGDINYNKVNVYPNPGRGLIKISNDISDDASAKTFHYSVFNSSGVRIADGVHPGYSGTLVDISAYPAGLYIIIMYRDDGIKTIKYSLIK